MSAEPIETAAELVSSGAVSATANGPGTGLEIVAEKKEFSTTIVEAESPAALAALEQREKEAVLKFARKARADSTLRAYEAAWREFEVFCSRRQLCALPADPLTVARYITVLADAGQKTSTIAKKLSAVSVRHRRAHYPSPRKHVLVSETLSGINREKGTRTKKKAPIRTDDLRLMMEALDLETPMGVRDAALLMIGFGGARRRSELAALNDDDLEIRGDWLHVFVETSKTDQERKGFEVAMQWGREELLCPIRSLERWRRVSGISGGPIWRPINKAGRIGDGRLDAREVGRVVKRTIQRAGLNPASYAGHSLRSGFITSAAELGVAERDIMRQSGHKSVTVMRGYIEAANVTRDNAAAAVLGKRPD